MNSAPRWPTGTPMEGRFACADRRRHRDGTRFDGPPPRRDLGDRAEQTCQLRPRWRPPGKERGAARTETYRAYVAGKGGVPATPPRGMPTRPDGKLGLHGRPGA
jgi:hypothetical protein